MIGVLEHTAISATNPERSSTDVPGDIKWRGSTDQCCQGEPVEYRPGVWVAYFYGPDKDVLELRQAEEED